MASFSEDQLTGSRPLLRVIKSILFSRISGSEMSIKVGDLTEERLIWIDMEMTGLDPVNDHVLEVACVVTNGNMDVIAENPSMIVHQPDHILESMDKWCIKQHGQSGLTSASRKSTLTIQNAEQQLITFLRMHTPPGKCPLAGNSVYMDRLFLQRYMPLVDKHIHYRIVDVSSLKELCKRWYPQQYLTTPKKKLAHRAMIDIHESIEELRYYRKTMFSPIL